MEPLMDDLDGALKPTAASVTIRVHGAMARHFAV